MPARRPRHFGMLDKRHKGLFVEATGLTILAASTSSIRPPFEVESLREFSPAGEQEALRAFVDDLVGHKSQRYVPSHCAVYPESRFFRRHSIESAAKVKDQRYFTDLLSNQFRIDPAKNVAAVLVATDGNDFDPEKPIANQKELLICGAGKHDLQRAQERLLDVNIFPETLQIGSINLIGGLINYLSVQEESGPILFVELTPETANLFIVTPKGLDLCRPVSFGLNGMFAIIQSELGLKDEDSARRLFHSETFDFTEMGPQLVRRLVKELQASTGFYEVQTGQTIEYLFLSPLPKNLRWLEPVLTRALGVRSLAPAYRPWLEKRGIKVGGAVQLDNLEPRWLGLFSLMGELGEVAHAA